jgi:methionyl-tRNA formyltransferase
MRILFIGGLYRGLRLAERLLERGAHVIGAYAYEEDAHESPKYSNQIVSLFSAHGIPVEATRRITKDLLPAICHLAPDIAFCLGWRTLIPTEILACAPMGGIAVHDSLLPRLRGFAPTNWGMILGHDQLGATLFQLTDSVDAGNIYFQQAIEPGPNESYESIQHSIADASVRLFDLFLDASRDGTLSPRAQNEAAATFTCARTPADGEIDWRQPNHAILRLIRALAPPAPPAVTYLLGAPLHILRARLPDVCRNYEGRIAGRVIDRKTAAGTVDVLCGEGILQIERVRTADGQELPAAAVIRSIRDTLGLNHSQEILALRTRLEQLESQLAGHRAAA